MSVISHIRGSLANAQLEVSKHVNAASINRAIQDVRNSVDSAAPQISQTGRSNQAIGEEQRSLDSAFHRPDEAALGIHPDVEIAMILPEDASKKATNQAETGNIATSDDITGECSSIASEAANEKIDREPSVQSYADRAQTAARRLGKAAWENPVLTAATVVTGAGVAVVAAPAVVTAPFMAIAGVAGFTPTGIAATSAASAIHAWIGNVAAGSIFATVQSAAAGGYGVAAVAGAAQTAGGYVAGVGGIGTAATWWKGKSKSKAESSTETTE
ncbi:hypothetical protein ACHAQJ_009040 [Trichoderma viride]